MTPAQSEIIIQEYVQMNSSENDVREVPLSDITSTPVQTATLDAESTARLKAEMAKLKNP